MSDPWKKIREAKEAYEAEIRKVGKAEVLAVFQSFFDANPCVKTIQWTQYTPYFNDGEPCVFRMDDLHARFDVENEDEDEEQGDDGDGGWYPFSSRYWRDRPDVRPSWVTEAHMTALDSLGQISIPEDVSLAVFGEGKIIATRDGIDVEDYDHE